jgi:hypothetical protein
MQTAVFDHDSCPTLTSKKHMASAWAWRAEATVSVTGSLQKQLSTNLNNALFASRQNSWAGQPY